MECFEYLVINPHMKSMELIEVFSPTKFLRVQLTDSLTWCRSTTVMIKLANQYCLRKLKRASVLIKRVTVESVIYKHLVLQMQPLKQEASAEGRRHDGVSLFSVQELFQTRKASEKQKLMQKTHHIVPPDKAQTSRPLNSKQLIACLMKV